MWAIMMWCIENLFNLLSGKHDIKVRQAKALAARFGVSVAAFI
jgi:antitoxin component HigA of HigAB toxin-antitoxin module